MREAEVVMAGRRKQADNAYNLAYYQAYMSGVFSQQYAKNKFPKYGTNAPWLKIRGKRGPDYDKRLERMMHMLTVSMGGSVH